VLILLLVLFLALDAVAGLTLLVLWRTLDV
jgi:hypothetical protein